MALSKIKMYPAAREIRSEYITARDQSMVESGVTKGGKTLPVFTFGDENKKSPQPGLVHNTNMKPQAKTDKKQRFSWYP